MSEFALRLFETEGFEPQGIRGPWTPALKWLHIGGDLFIWLSFISIPLVLLYFTRRRDLPYPRLFVLFALFILACGFGHLIDALVFQYPVYRLAGVWKVVTAVLSWATVLALIPVIPRVMASVDVPRVAGSFGDTTLHRLAAPVPLVRLKDYIIAILAGVLALLLRAAVDPLTENDHVYVLSLLAVVFVSWQCGFGPGILTLVISMAGMMFFFIPPRYSFVVAGVGNQLATALFFFVGVCCAALGEAQRIARRRTRVALEVALERKAELEAEVARRMEIESSLRQREADLIEVNRQLAAAQTQTAEALARYRTLTEAIPQIVWNADANGEVSYFNQRWLDYTGLPIEQAHGRGWMDALHPEDRDRVFAEWRATVKSREPGSAGRFAHEVRLRNAATDEYRWFLTVAVPLRREDGRVDQWIGSMADIHDQKTAAETLERMVRSRTAALVDEIDERRRAEQQVRAVATELERSNAELEQFAYIASHDLQEPLRKIQAFGDRLRNRYRAELPDGGKEYVDRMHSSAARMRRLIDDLLNYSRVTTTARPFQRVDLSELAREVVGDLEERIEQAGATVDVGELPEIDADPSQMRQLFQNLMVNAVKFQRPDVPPVVEIRGEPILERLPGSGDEPVPACRITVRDNGIGFDEKYLDRIFQVFQRLHGREEYEGTGVGLAICRKIVERHGGTITARSRVGEGTTFVVTLPVRQPREEAAADVQHKEPGHDPDGR